MGTESYCPFFLVLLVALLASPLQADEFEEGANLKARKVLPAELRKGEYFKVDRKVRNDGFLNTYIINSDFGDFEAYSTHMLRIRVNEISALGRLSELSRTEVFATSAIEAGLSPITAIIDFSTRPIQSVLGLPGGIARMFSRYGRRTEAGLQRVGQAFSRNSSDGSSESNQSKAARRINSFTEDFFGVGGAERRWHQKLGTDPYTSNDTLKAAIKSVSWADGLGRFALSRVNLSSVAAADVIGRVNGLVWSLDAYELQQRNRKILLELGFDEMLIELVLTSPTLTPTAQTTLITAIQQLEGVEKLGELLALALLLEDEPQVHVLIESALMLVDHHEQYPLAELVPMTPVPAARSKSGDCISVIALDHLAWTRSSAALMELLNTGAGESGHKTLVLSGSVSKRARSELEDRGWRIADHSINKKG